MYSDSDFVVAGIDDGGNGTVLFECDNSGEAIEWWRKYVQREDAGGWDAVYAYDARGDEWERIKSWDRERVEEFSASPDPADPDNYWIDDKTGERICAETGERA